MTKEEELVFFNHNDLVAEALSEFSAEVENYLDSLILENATYDELDSRDISYLSEASILLGEEILGDLLLTTEQSEDATAYSEEILQIASFLDIEKAIPLNYLDNIETSNDVFVCEWTKLKESDFLDRKFEIVDGESVYEIQFPSILNLPVDYYTLITKVWKENPFNSIDFSSSFEIGASTNLGSDFLSITLLSLSTFAHYSLDDLEEEIEITFPALYPTGEEVDPSCVYIAEGENILSGAGITLLNVILSNENTGSITCATDHLTSFSVSQEPVKIMNEANFEELANVEALESYKFYESASKSYFLSFVLVFWLVIVFSIICISLMIYFYFKDKKKQVRQDVSPSVSGDNELKYGSSNSPKSMEGSEDMMFITDQNNTHRKNKKSSTLLNISLNQEITNSFNDSKGLVIPTPQSKLRFCSGELTYTLPNNNKKGFQSESSSRFTTFIPKNPKRKAQSNTVKRRFIKPKRSQFLEVTPSPYHQGSCSSLFSNEKSASAFSPTSTPSNSKAETKQHRKSTTSTKEASSRNHTNRRILSIERGSLTHNSIKHKLKHFTNELNHSYSENTIQNNHNNHNSTIDKPKSRSSKMLPSTKQKTLNNKGFLQTPPHFQIAEKTKPKILTPSQIDIQNKLKAKTAKAKLFIDIFVVINIYVSLLCFIMLCLIVCLILLFF